MTDPHTGIDFSPLIPVVNGMITAAAGLLSASTPVLIGYAFIWLRNHGIAAKAGAQKLVVDRINATIENGLRFATTSTDDAIRSLKVAAPNAAIATAANYAIAQSPDLLKKAGYDVTTEAGQAALVRLVTAKSVPPPASETPKLDVNLTSSDQR